MKFNLEGRNAYVIQDDENGCYIYDHIGLAMEADQMEQLAKRLLKTAKAKDAKEQIKKYNEAREAELHDIFGGKNNSKKEPKPKKAAYVYMLECGGRYKIGFSCDVDRRAAELDNRPFPVNIIAVSKATVNAFEKEQYIHTRLEHLRINGEWYEMSPEGAERVKQYIERIF